MKVKCLFFLLIIVLCTLPVCCANSPDNITLDDSNSPLEAMDSINDEVSTSLSYFEGNNSIEEPMTDDDFANPKISFTDRNTFYVNSSYSGQDELGTVSNPFKAIDSAFSSLTLNRSVVNIFIAKGDYEVSKTISITKNLNIIGENPLDTIISGANVNHMFLVEKNNLVISIINLTFICGSNYYGGAIYNNRSTVKLVNDIFKDNVAVGYNSTFENYSAAGGALYNDAGTYKIYNSSFINNSATSSLNVYAGAIYNDLGTLSILNSRFINNTVKDASYGSGGAIYNFNGFLTVCNSVFINNTVDSDFSIGGGIYSYESHNVYIINSTFDSNSIYGNYTMGSAVANSASLLEIVNSTIINSYAAGIAPLNSTVYSFNGVYNFINSTMANNTIEKPINNLLLCLEDQFISSDVFDGDMGVLPSKYDLRDYNLVTYAKNQGGSGACWAFSTIAALESYLRMYENLSYDFSENNLKNLMNYQGINGTDWPDGGNYQMAIAYFLRWDGPVDENDDYYSAYSTIPSYGLTPLKHVQGVMFLPIRFGYLDNDQIKYAIMKYGGLYTSVYGTSMIKNVYNSVAEIPNHAVTIVGWDDNYPANRFLGTKPPGNGAWIIKNSWGQSYGDKGFGYVSYYDKTFAGFGLDSLSAMAFTDVENTTNYKNIYQYDILGNTFESLGFNNNTVWMANQFEAVSDNPLSAFGMYTYGKSTYIVEVYVNGELKYSSRGSLDYAGYHTVKLSEPVELSEGDMFRINVRLTTPDSLFPVAIESSRVGYSGKATAELNQSFISCNGIDWIDIADELELVKLSGCMYNRTLNQANVCLKACTANVADLQLNITSDLKYFFKDDEITFTFNLTNFGDYSSDINVSFDFGEAMEIVNADSSCGIFTNGSWFVKELNHQKSVILNVTCRVVEITDFIVNEATLPDERTVTFNLTYAGFTEFVMENVTVLSKSGDKINITLKDCLSNPISNATVTVIYDNVSSTYTSDENGVVEFCVDLFEANYTCTVSFNGTDILKPANGSFNVNVIRRNSSLTNVTGGIFFYPDAPILQLKDENGQAMANKSIVIRSGDVSFDLTSDENGRASRINLKSGNYTLLCSFEGDELYYPSQCILNVSIVKRQTILSCGDSVAVAGMDGHYLEITLTDAQSNPLANKSIEVRLNSRVCHADTNESGIARLEIDVVKSGSYPAEINFSGDDAYYGSFKGVNVKVEKQKVRLKLPKKTYKASKKAKKLTASLKDNNGKAIAGKKLIFKVNGKKYCGITNKKGTASVKVKITKKKRYVMSVTFKGDATYAKIIKKSKLIIK